MSLADQVRSLAKAGADMRLSIFGVDSLGEKQQLEFAAGEPPVPCYFSAVRSQQQLDDANMKAMHDCIVRVAKSETRFTPRLGQEVKLIAAANDGSDLTVRFNEFGNSGVNPEWVLGCASLT